MLSCQNISASFITLWMRQTLFYLPGTAQFMSLLIDWRVFVRVLPWRYQTNRWSDWCTLTFVAEYTDYAEWLDRAWQYFRRLRARRWTDTWSGSQQNAVYHRYYNSRTYALRRGILFSRLYVGIKRSSVIQVIGPWQDIYNKFYRGESELLRWTLFTLRVKL